MEEETEELDEKPLYDPLSWNDPLVNKLVYKDTKRPSKLNLPKVLEPLQVLATNGILGVLSSLVIQVPQYCLIASTKPHRLILANT